MRWRREGIASPASRLLAVSCASVCVIATRLLWRRKMTKRVEMGPPYPPRAMRIEQAAAYLSMSRATFFRLVEEGKMPSPVKVKGMTMWDRYDLDDAFEELKHGCGEPTENTVHKRLRELEDEQRKKRRPE
jgi:excisionase family DNA binding protein